MSNNKQEPFKVGDLVFDTVSGKNGTVKVVEDYYDWYGSVDKQVVVLNVGSTAKDWVAVEVPRLHRGEDASKQPLKRLGTPPKIVVGDAVDVMGMKCRVYAFLNHGVINVQCVVTGKVDTVRWPHYRKVKKDKGGLGKFRRGDLVRLPSAKDPRWLRVIGIGVSGMLDVYDPVLNLNCAFTRRNFKDLERKPAPTSIGEVAQLVFDDKAPNLPTLADVVQAIMTARTPKTDALLANVGSNPTVDEVRVKLLNDTLQLVKDFAAEKDGSKAAKVLESIVRSLDHLSPVCGFALWQTFDVIFDTKAKEVVNAYS